MKLVEPDEEIYAIWIKEEDFTMFDLFYTNAGYKTVDNNSLNSFANHYGYFVVDKRDKTIGFMETLAFSTLQDKDYGILELIKDES